MCVCVRALASHGGMWIVVHWWRVREKGPSNGSGAVVRRRRRKRMHQFLDGLRHSAVGRRLRRGFPLSRLLSHALRFATLISCSGFPSTDATKDGSYRRRQSLRTLSSCNFIPAGLLRLVFGRFGVRPDLRQSLHGSREGILLGLRFPLRRSGAVVFHSLLDADGLLAVAEDRVLGRRGELHFLRVRLHLLHHGAELSGSYEENESVHLASLHRAVMNSFDSTVEALLTDTPEIRTPLH